MPISNIGNTVQASPARLTGDSAPDVVHTSTAATQSASVGLPAGPVVEPQASAAQLQNVVDSINKTLLQANKNIQFSVDSDTKRTVVKLMDMETGDVIRQYPSKEALAISQSIDQIQQGLLLKQKA